MISAGQLISERVMLKRDQLFAVSGRDGSMKPGEFLGDGLWSRDTRILSTLRLLIDGTQPESVAWQVDGNWASFVLRQESVHMTRQRYISSGLHELITVANRGSARVETVLTIEVAADFAAMLGIRGAVPSLASPTQAPPIKTNEGVRFERGEIGVRVSTRPEGLQHELHLEPGQEFTLELDVLPDSVTPTIEFAEGLLAAKDENSRWVAESMSVRTDNPALNELLERAVADIGMLSTSYDTGIYPTAGLPWYAVPFGRDALITSMLLLHVNPSLARGVLRYLAKHQGRQVDENTEEQPGKIMHEVRFGEVVERGLWPHILYGTIDATALFLCALTETETWTHDHKFADELLPAADAALEWCGKFGDADGDGYIEYSGGRARNQGWKDSDDSLTNTDGMDASRPAALCEVQGYLYRGLVGMSRRRPELKKRAAALKLRFNRDFWIEREKFLAQALDGSKRQVQAITSNPGHCLWMRIVEPTKALHVAERLASPDLFSGWGVRTLSAHAVNYDPCSYHNGSVWPFDTALAVVGMRHYGLAEHATRIARGLIEAAMEFPLRRPPELFCGDDRVPGAPPKEYWNTCTPQLWSSAAMFACVSSMLGLEANPNRNHLRVAPIETSLWKRIEVSGLHFAGHRVDFSVEGTRVRVGRLPGGIRVNYRPLR